MIAKPNSALISWENSTRAINYRVYLVIQEMLIPINDGEGLDVKTNQVTMNSVFLFFFSTFEFFSLQIKKNKHDLTETSIKINSKIVHVVQSRSYADQNSFCYRQKSKEIFFFLGTSLRIVLF